MNCSARVLTCLALAALQGPSWAQSRWQPEVFPISYWVGPQVDYNNLEAWQTVKDCNFTVAGPACWSKQPADLVAENRKMLDLCGQVGLKAIVIDGRLAWTLPQEDNWKDKVAQVVADYGSHPALFGYFLQDEPNLEQFEGLGALGDELQRQDPVHPPYINLFPTYASVQQLGTPTYADHLERFLTTSRPLILSYDHYCLMAGGVDKPDFFENMELIREAGLRHSVPTWNIIQACSWTPGVRQPSETEMRWQVYTSLAYGFKGILYFVYWSWNNDDYASAGIVDNTGKPGRLYPIVKQLNGEMLALGPTLLRCTSTGVFHTGPIPTGARRLSRDAILQVPSEVPLVVGFLRDDAGAEYAFVVNRDHDQPVEFEATLMPHVVGVTEVSAADGQDKPLEMVKNRIRLSLAAGDGRLLRLQTRFAYPKPAEPVTTIDFRFDRENDMQGWQGMNSLAEPGWVDGSLQLTFTGQDPFMVRPMLRLKPDQYTKLRVRMKLPACNAEGQVFWTTSEEPGFADNKYLNFAVTPDGEWHEYEIPVASHAKWRGQAIRGLRLDPTTGGATPGTKVEIAWIKGE